MNPNLLSTAMSILAASGLSYDESDRDPTVGVLHEYLQRFLADFLRALEPDPDGVQPSLIAWLEAGAELLARERSDEPAEEADANYGRLSADLTELFVSLDERETSRTADAS